MVAIRTAQPLVAGEHHSIESSVINLRAVMAGIGRETKLALGTDK
jgi:hypothetical protein